MIINSSTCDLCGTCVSVCPTDAIIISEFKINLNVDKCIECSNCVYACPMQAIKVGSND